MAARRSARGALSLKDFMQRQDVLRLYRDCFRAMRVTEDPDYRVYLRDWVRERFANHRNEKDPHEIKLLVAVGRAELNQFLQLANCAPAATHRTFRSRPEQSIPAATTKIPSDVSD